MTKVKKQYSDNSYINQITTNRSQIKRYRIDDENNSNYGSKYHEEEYDAKEPVENIVGLNHKFSIIQPIPLANIDKEIPLIKFPSYYSVEPTFEYLSTQWEESTAILQESKIPNVYVENTPHLQSVMAFPGVDLDRSLIKNYKKRNLDKRYASRVTSGEALKNVIFLNPISNYADKASYVTNYPFYNKITLYEKNNELQLKDKLVELSLMAPLIRSFISDDKQLVDFQTLNDNSEPETKTFEVFDILKWLKNPWSDSYELTEVSLEPPLKNDFLQPLNRIDMYTEILKRNERRTAKAISEGRESYSETLFYKIEKRNRTTGEFLQCFYVTAQEQEINLFDTQIKYGVEYEYICYSCKVVYGSNVTLSDGPPAYFANNQSLQHKDGKKYLNIEPSIQLITAEMFSDSCVVLQPPQPMPDVSFYNNKQISNKIKIMASLNANRYLQDFIPLSADETTQTEIINEKYRKRMLKDYFHFESEHALFEIFRMDRQPRSYSEFKQNKIGEFRNTIPSTSAFFQDSILIDKDYYYTIRSINTHGFLSNPSPIYKVRQTQDADETFLSVETVGFLEEEPFQKTLKFQKLLQLVPGTLHTVYDLRKEQGFDQETLKGKVDQLSLGMASEPVWGKKFKLRVTSTDTGKKIDLNVTVKLTKHKTSEDL